MISRRAIAGLIAGTMTVALAACGDGLDRGDAPAAIGFGGVESAGPNPGWRAIAADMGQTIDVEVRPFVGSNQNALVEAMRFGQADVGWFSAAGALAAVERADGQVFARTVGRDDADPGQPLVWRKDLDPAVKEKVRQFFLTYGQGPGEAAEAQRAELARLSLRGFLAADDAVLLPVREVAAARALEAARASGDPAKIEAAGAALDDIRRRRIDLKAKAGQPLAAP